MGSRVKANQLRSGFLACFLFPFLLLNSGCQKENANSAQTERFFSNGERTAPSPEEQGMFVRFGRPGQSRGCTAFPVANTRGKNIYGSSMQCVNQDASGWCDAKGSIYSSEGVQLGICNQIVLESHGSDLFLFHVELTPVAALHPARPLRLAAFAPEKDARLKMFGYPKDSARKAAATVTKGCWVLENNILSKKLETLAAAKKSGIDVKNPPEEWKERLAETAREDDGLFKHNCTVTDGNDGGPLTLEGSDIVVGIPKGYFKEGSQPTRFSADNLKTAAKSASMASFVALNRVNLEPFGIVFADSPNPLRSEIPKATSGTIAPPR